MIEEAESIEEAETLDYEEDPREAPRRRRGRRSNDQFMGLNIPRKQGIMGVLGVVAVVIMIMLVALVADGFGIVPGVKETKVFIPGGQGEEGYYDVISWPSLPDDRIADDTVINDIEIRTTAPSFGGKKSGDADVKVTYEGETIYTTTASVDRGDGKFDLDYSEFYISNGEYKINVDFKGKSGSDSVTIMRTVEYLNIIQYSYTDTSEEEYFVIKLTYRGDQDDEENMDRSIFTWGEGDVNIYYVSDQNEADKNNKANWEYVDTIDYEITPTSFDYVSQNHDAVQGHSKASDSDFNADFIEIPRDYIDEDSQGQERETGNYTCIVTFTNDFGNKDHGSFDDEVKEGYPKDEFTHQRLWTRLAKEEDDR